MLSAAQREIEGLPLPSQVIRWEEHYYRAQTDFQDQLTLRPSQTDLVVVVLWSRLGTPLPPRYARPDGSLPTGAEYEFEEAMAAAREHGAPDLLVYRKTMKMAVAPDTEERSRINAEVDRVEAFWRVWFRSEEGHFTAGYKPFTTTEEFAATFRGDLRKWLRDTGWLGAPAVWRVAELGSPFCGLESFDEAHALVFFGRRRAVDQALRKLAGGAGRGCPFLLVLGPSGSGKSSLLRAGLVARLLNQPGAVPGVDLWRRCVVRVGALGVDALAGLAAALWQTGALPELAVSDSASPTEFAELMRRHPLGAARAVQHALERAAANSPLARQKDERPTAALLLVLDQLEELFIQPWADELGEAITALVRSRAVWVAASLRTDFYPAFQKASTLLRLKADGDELDLIPPSEAELGEIIRGPARVAGLEYEPDPTAGDRLDDRLLEAARGPGMLPLLQFTLEELFKARAGHTLTLAAYAAFGKLEGAIGRRAQAVLEALPKPVQAELSEVLLELVESSEDRVGVRVRLLAAIATSAEREQLIDALVKARFLVADAAGQRVTVRLAHEALLTHWPAACAALDANRDFVRLRDRMDRAARDWQRTSRAPDELLTAERSLGEASELLSRHRTRIAAETIEFLESSLAARGERDEAERRKAAAELAREQSRLAQVDAAQARTARAQRRSRWALFAVAGIVAVGIAAVALQQLRLGESQHSVAVEKVSLLAGLSAIERSRGGFDGAFRLATLAARVGLGLGQRTERQLPAGANLASLVASTWRVLLSGHTDVVRSVAWRPGSAYVLTASWDGTARIWNATTGEQMALLDARDGMIVHRAAFSPDGTRIVTAAGGAYRTEAPDIPYTIVLGGRGRGTLYLWSTGIARIWDADTATGDETARIWKLTNVLAVHRQPPRSFAQSTIPPGRPLDPRRPMFETGFNDAAFSPDGERIAISSWDGKARVWDAVTDKQIAELSGHKGPVYSVMFSPDGSRIVTASDDMTARLWNAATGQQMLVFTGHKERVNSAIFSSDGTLVLTASNDKTGALWDAITGQRIALFQGDALMECAAFSPDSKRILTASRDKIAQVWDVATAKQLVTMRGHHSEVDCASFSPDGTRVVTASMDATARLWDATTGNEIIVLLGHGSAVYSAAFSRDGRRIITASQDRTARIWDADTGKEIVTLRAHGDALNSAVFSPDATRAVTASLDSSVRVWDVHFATMQTEGLIQQFSFWLGARPL
jgi:WD40 repeat protein